MTQALVILVLPFMLNLLAYLLVLLITKGDMLHTIWQPFMWINASAAPAILLVLFGFSERIIIYLLLCVQIVIVTGGLIGLLLHFKQEAHNRIAPRGYIWITLCVLLLVSNVTISRKQSRNIIEGHGFAYANGFSSVDLWEYEIENPDNKLPVLEQVTYKVSDRKKMPVLDGAEAAYPVYSAFANNVYAHEELTNYEEALYNPVQFSNTIYAFESLVAGEVDIFFGAKPSKNQIKLAEDAGLTLNITPIGQEAFIFIVSDKNSIESLTTEQIQAIYSGEIENWKELGGANKRILAFQRPEDSGSQTMMHYFMGEQQLIEPLRQQYVSAMSGVYDEVADYQGQTEGIAYSFRFFSQMSGREGFKIVPIDNIPVTPETITNGTYPFVVPLVAVTIAERETQETKDFVAWMQGEEGQQIIEEIGYVKLGNKE